MAHLNHTHTRTRTHPRTGILSQEGQCEINEQLMSIARQLQIGVVYSTDLHICHCCCSLDVWHCYYPPPPPHTTPTAYAPLSLKGIACPLSDLCVALFMTALSLVNDKQA